MKTHCIFLLLLSFAANVASEPIGNTQLSAYNTAQSLIDSGDVLAAIKEIQPLVDADPAFGDGVLTLYQAMYLNQQYDQALALALSAQKQTELVFSGRKNSWFRHSLLGGLMYQGRLSEAQSLIVALYPNIQDLPEKPVEPLNLRLGVPLHTVIAYIHILRATGRDSIAEKIAAHYQGFTAEAFFDVEENALNGAQSWMLASIWAADPQKKADVVRLLKQAYGYGFRAGWPFNYHFHPVYWSLRDEPEFKAILKHIKSTETGG